MEAKQTSNKADLARVLPAGAASGGPRTPKDRPMQNFSEMDSPAFDPLADLLGEPIKTSSGDPISETDLADLLGLTSSRIRTLARDGVIKRTGRATYDRREAVRSYCHALREALLKKGRPSGGGDALAAEKLRLATAQAEKIEMANAAARGELVSVAEVAREWAGVLRTVRAALLALPSRVGSRLGHLTPHDLSEMDLEVRAVLGELSESDHGN